MVRDKVARGHIRARDLLVVLLVALHPVDAERHREKATAAASMRKLGAVAVVIGRAGLNHLNACVAAVVWNIEGEPADGALEDIAPGAWRCRTVARLLAREIRYERRVHLLDLAGPRATVDAALALPGLAPCATVDRPQHASWSSAGQALDVGLNLVCAVSRLKSGRPSRGFTTTKLELE
eukprot:624908-Prymnesium_polylepis.1